MAAGLTGEGVPQTQAEVLSSPDGSPSGAPSNFGIATYARGDTMCVAPTGELDIATVDQLEDCLRRLHAARSPNLLLDLSQLGFIDSAGLHLILRWNELARRQGFEFKIVEGPRIVRRVFEITGLRSVLSVVSDESAMEMEPKGRALADPLEEDGAAKA